VKIANRGRLGNGLVTGTDAAALNRTESRRKPERKVVCSFGAPPIILLLLLLLAGQSFHTTDWLSIMQLNWNKF